MNVSLSSSSSSSLSSINTGASNSGGSQSSLTSSRLFCSTVYKPTVCTPLGARLWDAPFSAGVIIVHLDTHGLFAKPKLLVGLQIRSINGIDAATSSWATAAAMQAHLDSLQGRVCIVAALPPFCLVISPRLPQQIHVNMELHGQDNHDDDELSCTLRSDVSKHSSCTATSSSSCSTAATTAWSSPSLSPFTLSEQDAAVYYDYGKTEECGNDKLKKDKFALVRKLLCLPPKNRNRKRHLLVLV